MSRTATTDDKGHYEFDKLPAGDYTIEFEVYNGSRYVVTARQVSGVSELLNSDATSRHKSDMRDGAYIELATMPRVEDMTSSRYVDDHEDIGVVIMHNSLTNMPQTGATPWLLLLGGMSLLGTLFSVMLLLGATKDKKRK